MGKVHLPPKTMVLPKVCEYEEAGAGERCSLISPQQ
jgi:hypothetical protein